MKTKLLSLLALMLTAVSGAWADSFSADAYAANATLNGVSVTANQTVTINKDVTVTVNNGLTISTGVTLTVTGGGTLVVNGATGAKGNDGYFETYSEGPFDPPVDIFVNPTAGGNGGAAITINGSAQLALSNATVIANGGQGGQGGMGVNGDETFWAASGANGNGFSSFPTIDGAVLSYSTNGTDYTEYASGNSTLYRYMKAVAVAPATTYTATMKEGTEDADNWSITPNEGLNENDQITLKYSGSNMVKSIKVKKVAAPEPDKLEFVEFTDGTNTVKFANMNLGATSIADGTSSYGDYYAWAATEPFGTVSYTAYNAGTVTATKEGGYSEANTPYRSGYTFTKYTSHGAILEAMDDAATAKMGEGYRMPTMDDFNTLCAACGGADAEIYLSSIATGAAYAKGIYWVAGAETAVTVGGDEYKANGALFVQDADHHIFFPMAGRINGDNVFVYDGYYWSSTLITDTSSNDYLDAHYMCLNQYYVGHGYQYYTDRQLGFPIRPVKD